MYWEKLRISCHFKKKVINEFSIKKTYLESTMIESEGVNFYCSENRRIDDGRMCILSKLNITITGLIQFQYYAGCSERDYFVNIIVYHS